MKLFIDCEWNGFRGDLISMAIVDEDGDSFYEVLDCPNPCEWVEKHVTPVLNKAPVERSYFEEELRHFLSQYDDIVLIADWPEDIAHFCQVIVTEPLKHIGLSRMDFVVNQSLFAAISAIPHNALADAEAIRNYCLISDVDPA